MNVILDRDGVINHNNITKPGRGWYTLCWNDFEFIDGAESAIVDLLNNGHDVYIVTMQNCVVDGTLQPFEVDDIHSRLIEHIATLTEDGSTIRQICACSTPIEDGTLKMYAKRNAIIYLASKYGFSTNNTIVVGDSEHDMDAGNALGCTTIFIHRAVNIPDVEYDVIATSLMNAAKYIKEL